MTYQEIKWKPSHYSYVSQAEADRVRSMCANADAHNLEEHKRMALLHSQLIAAAVELYGPNAKAVRYLSSNPPPNPPSHKAVLKAIEYDLLDGKAADDRRAARAKRKEKQDYALLALEEAGFVLGKDFTRSNAISFAARNITYEDGRYLPVQPIPIVEPPTEPLTRPGQPLDNEGA